MSVARSELEPSVRSSVTREVGLKCFAEREFATAVDCLERCLQSHPDDQEILNSLARSLEGLGRLEDALIYVNRSIALQPQNVAEHVNRAHLLDKLGRQSEALTALDQALRVSPADVDVLIKRAYLLYRVGRREEALASAHQAVLIDPQHLNALNTRGMLLDDLGRRDDASADFETILAKDPDYADAITNRAILHARAGEFVEALAAYDRSLALQPDQSNAIYNRSVVRLVMGDWIQGFREFESRWVLFPHEALRLRRLAPPWDGQADLQGKTVLLHHEQGYGDTLQLCRYVTEVKRRGARVLIAVPAALKRLMETLPGSPTVVSEGEPVPPHDFHCPLMSLPLACKTTPSTVPATIPYLQAKSDAANAWASRFGPRCRVRIGLVWSGRRYPPINHARDMTFEAIRPILSLDADFVCLHPELSEDESAAISAYPQIQCLHGHLVDFADTAAVIANLDLVISVDSAVAHLAGALGKPVWLMNRYASCWRWLLNRADSPWYPSLRLFRQPRLGDWAAVVQDICRAGAVFLAQARPAKRTTPANDPSRGMSASDCREDLSAALDRHNQGDLTGAISRYQSIRDRHPNDLETLHYCGIALCQAGRYSEALEPLQRALRLDWRSPTLHSHYGNALIGLCRYAQAVPCYERAIEIDPTLAEAHYNLGIANASLGHAGVALHNYERAIALNPSHARAHNNRGNVLLDAGDWAAALHAYDQALDSDPHLIDALINRAHLLRRQHQYDAALVSADRAVQLEPSHAQALNGRGAVLADMGRPSDALACYDRALASDPTLAEARWNKGLIKLANGEFREGWALYESRMAVKSLNLAQRFTAIPRLRPGDDVQNKAVILYAEQGYGDTIQFCRYYPQLVARGARVSLNVPQPLEALLAPLCGNRLPLTSNSDAAFDFQSPLPSLPYVFNTDLTTIAASMSYLCADPIAARRWADSLGSEPQTLRIGLAWSGRETHQNDHNRSIPLKTLLPLTSHPAQWISLQKEVRTSDRDALSTETAIERCGERLTDFADTAGLIEHLDLVITVDTAVAHVAGAMGKRVWILLPYVADWRWMTGRRDSPWYPTARLFRQSTSRRWEEVVEQVGDGLKSLVKEPARQR